MIQFDLDRDHLFSLDHGCLVLIVVQGRFHTYNLQVFTMNTVSEFSSFHVTCEGMYEGKLSLVLKLLC